MSNQTKIARKVIDLEQGTVEFIFADGDTMKLIAEELPANIQRQAMLHGLSQTCGDNYAGATKECIEEGMTPIDYAKAVLESRFEGLANGDWYRKREGGNNLTVRALAIATDDTLENAMKAWASWDEEKQKQVRKHPAFKEAYLRLKQEALQQAAANAKPLTL